MSMIVDAQLHAVALDVAAGVGVLGRVRLGLDHILVAGDALEGLAEIDVRAVLVGDVEEADPPVERVADDPGEFLDPSRVWLLAWPEPMAAGPHADERDLDARLAQGHLVGRALGQARPRAADTVVDAAARAVVATVACKKSRRFRGDFMADLPPGEFTGR